MRRGSLVGPFLLIGLGVVLLINNLQPDLSLLDLAAKYWPFVLVAWGVLRILELAVLAMKTRPLPYAGVTGAEWAIVILICIVGASTDYARIHWPNARITMHGLEVFGEAFDFPLAAKQEVGERPQVFVENLRGNVRIVGGDSSEVTVEGRTTVRAFDQAEAEQSNAKCPLEVVRQGDQITIRTNHARASGASKITTDLDIVVPKGSSVEGRGRYGDFDISNVAGNVEINSDNAGVRLTGIGGDARIDLRRSDVVRIINLTGSATISGRGEDIELEGIEGLVSITGSYSGELSMRRLARPLVFESKRTKLRIEQTPGRVRMALGNLTAEGLVGPIALETSSRDVNLTDFTGSLDLEIERGDVELRPGLAGISGIEVDLKAGDIVLSVPAAIEFGLAAETASGEVVNEFDPSLEVKTEGERGAKMTRPAGKAPNVKLKTRRGDITIRATGSGQDDTQRLETTSA
jgi:DUF4097 and DUF4098 domain-containing protein YvlB